MWRGYGNKGYAIEIDKEKFEEKIKDEFERNFEQLSCGLLNGEVEYSANFQEFEAAKNNYFQEHCERVNVMIENLINNNFERIEDILGKKIFINEKGLEPILSLVYLSLMSKNYGFHEEREYRIAMVDSKLADRTFQIDENTKFYQKNDKLRSYIEILDGGISDLVSRIIIAPSPHSQNNKQKIETYLKSDPQLKDKTIKVEISEIPFIPE